jgi:pantoate--beta-alanine ligase
MILFKFSKDLQAYLAEVKRKQLTLGFVPTMGALHQGHLSLIKESKKTADLTVCSIFVNPTQFNNKDDFNKYPSTLEKDILLLEENGCDILFIPSETEIYPDESSKTNHFDLGHLETILEGKFRPGHFQGVCLIVEKLLHIVNPYFIFLGQKDYQQCLVIKRLIDLMHKDIKIVLCPILREPNGLAMSSRNLRLDEAEKNIASHLNERLNEIAHQLKSGNFLILKKNAIDYLEKIGFKVEYLELAHSKDLEIINDINCDEPGNYIIVIAAVLNNVRLIDNILPGDPC